MRTCLFLRNLVDVSEILFFCSAEGKGECEALGGGGIFIENPSRGVFWAGWGVGRGREGVCGEFGGGGLNIFIRGSHQGKILVSVKLFVRNSGAGNGILWAPGIFAFFLQENLHVHKIPGGGRYLGLFGGGVPILFLWARGFFWVLFVGVPKWVANCLYLCLSYLCRMELELQLPLPVAGLARKGLLTSWIPPSGTLRITLHSGQKRLGEAFLLTVGAFLLTVKLLCLQSLKALIRSTSPL